MSNSTSSAYREHPHTGFSSNFVQMKEPPAQVELHGVRLRRPGFEVVVDLSECDDRMQVQIAIVENDEPLFFNIGDYEYGYIATDGTYFGTDSDEQLDYTERYGLLKEIERLRAELAAKENA